LFIFPLQVKDKTHNEDANYAFILELGVVTKKILVLAVECFLGFPCSATIFSPYADMSVTDFAVLAKTITKL
jgi:hypothetical protein